MRHDQDPAEDDAMRPEYDFTNAVRGKYYQRYQQGTNVVVLEPDVASAFPTSESVNDALRSLLRLAKRSTGPVARPRRAHTKAAQAG